MRRVSVAECLVSVFMARIIFTSGRGAHVPVSRNPVKAATRLQLQNQVGLGLIAAVGLRCQCENTVSKAKGIRSSTTR
jgi:hypothetical protein